MTDHRSSPPRTDSVQIVEIFPDLLGTYGDGGNGVVLHQRLRWRGIPSELIEISSGQEVPDSAQIYLLGGGEDAPQTEAARALGADGPLHRAVDRFPGDRGSRLYAEEDEGQRLEPVRHADAHA